MNEYKNVRRVGFYFGEDIGTAVFVLVCPKCGRFVKANQNIRAGEAGLAPGPTATCSKCGPVEMPFEGFF